MDGGFGETVPKSSVDDGENCCKRKVYARRQLKYIKTTKRYEKEYEIGVNKGKTLDTQSEFVAVLVHKGGSLAIEKLTVQTCSCNEYTARQGGIVWK